jgi:hypothetical protein
VARTNKWEATNNFATRIIILRHFFNWIANERKRSQINAPQPTATASNLFALFAGARWYIEGQSNFRKLVYAWNIRPRGRRHFFPACQVPPPPRWQAAFFLPPSDVSYFSQSKIFISLFSVCALEAPAALHRRLPQESGANLNIEQFICRRCMAGIDASLANITYSNGGALAAWEEHEISTKSFMPY